MDAETCTCSFCNTVNASNWINVEDRLPKEEEDCLICSQEGLYSLATYLNKKWFPFFGPEFIKINFKVIAWMPLPSPPNIIDG